MDQQKPIIIFDYGGVLLEWDPRLLYRDIFAGDEAAVDQFLNDINFAAWNAELDRGKPYAQGVRELSAQFPQYASFIQAFNERWEESIKGPIQPVVDLLHRLKDNGYEVHGLSNWSQEKFPLMREKYDFFNLFDSMVISGEIGLIKPDPHIYAFLLEQINHKAQDCLFIDDSLKNIISAQAVGFDTIHFQSPPQLMAELESKGVAV